MVKFPAISRPYPKYNFTNLKSSVLGDQKSTIYSLHIVSLPQSLPFKEHLPGITIITQRALLSWGPEQWTCRVSSLLSSKNGFFQDHLSSKTIILTQWALSPQATWTINMCSRVFPGGTEKWYFHNHLPSKFTASTQWALPPRRPEQWLSQCKYQVAFHFKII